MKSLYQFVTIVLYCVLLAAENSTAAEAAAEISSSFTAAGSDHPAAAATTTTTTTSSSSDGLEEVKGIITIPRSHVRGMMMKSANLGGDGGGGDDNRNLKPLPSSSSSSSSSKSKKNSNSKKKSKESSPSVLEPEPESDPPQPGFFLVNSETNEAIKPIVKGDRFYEEEHGHQLNVLYVPNLYGFDFVNEVAYVQFTCNDDESYRTDSSTPFTVGGGNNNDDEDVDDFVDWNYNIGTQHIVAKAYDAGGVIIAEDDVYFQIFENQEAINIYSDGYTMYNSTELDMMQVVAKNVQCQGGVSLGNGSLDVANVVSSFLSVQVAQLTFGYLGAIVGSLQFFLGLLDCGGDSPLLRSDLQKMADLIYQDVQSSYTEGVVQEADLLTRIAHIYTPFLETAPTYQISDIISGFNRITSALQKPLGSFSGVKTAAHIAWSKIAYYFALMTREKENNNIDQCINKGKEMNLVLSEDIAWLEQQKLDYNFTVGWEYSKHCGHRCSVWFWTEEYKRHDIHFEATLDLSKSQLCQDETEPQTFYRVSYYCNWQDKRIYNENCNTQEGNYFNVVENMFESWGADYPPRLLWIRCFHDPWWDEVESHYNLLKKLVLTDQKVNELCGVSSDF